MTGAVLAALGVNGATTLGGTTSRGNMAVRTKSDGTIDWSLIPGILPSDVSLLTAVPPDNVYYVDGSIGSDLVGSGNGSEIAPFATIAAAMAAAIVEEYDELTIILGRGDYPGFTIASDFPRSLGIIGLTPGTVDVVGTITFDTPSALSHEVTVVQARVQKVSDITAGAMLDVEIIDGVVDEVTAANVGNTGTTKISAHVAEPSTANTPVELLTLANLVGFSPAVPGSWDTPPTEVAAALDALVEDAHSGVTLAGSLDYLTLAAQEITLNAIDLATDVTGGLPVANLANGTDGELITWDAAGEPATVPVGTATHVLTSNGAGSTPTFQAAPDTSTDVTLAGSLDYLTLAGQEITLNSIDLSTDVTGGLPVAGLADGTDGELITWDAAGVATTVPVGTATHVLTSGGAGTVPTFQVVPDMSTDVTLAGALDYITLVGQVLTRNAIDLSTDVTGGLPVANLAVGTDGELITWDAAGDPATVPVGTATHVLTSNGAGSTPTFQAVPDVSTDVTLAGALDYITLVGQVLTRNAIDLESDVTNNLPLANLAYGTEGELLTWDSLGAPATVPVGTATHVLTSAGAGAEPTFQVVPDMSTDVTLAGSLDYLTLVGQVLTRNAIDLATDVTGGLPVANLADGTDGELITWDAAGVAATVAAGTATHVLTSNGAGAAPTFQAVPGGGDDVTLAGSFDYLTLSAQEITLTAIDLATDVTGGLPVANLANGTDGELITWDAAGSPTTVPVGTATHVLTSNGAGMEPTFQVVPDMSTDVTLAGSLDYITLVGQVLTRNAIDLATDVTGGLPVANLADGTDGELITWDAAGVAATVAVGTATHVLTSNGAGAAPTFQAVPGGGDDVTLAGALDYLTLSAQEITLNAIDLATDVTGGLPVANLADGTDGELITWDAAGSPATVAVGTATHVLTSNGVGAAPTFQVVPDVSTDVTLAGSLDYLTLVGQVLTRNAIDLATDVTGGLPVANLANGTDGELITWDAAGAPTTVPVGTATHVLTSNGVGVAPTFQAPTDTTYTGGDGINISGGNEITVDLSTVDWNQQYLVDASSSYTVLDWANNLLVDNTNGYTAVDWEQRYLVNTNGYNVVEWEAQNLLEGATGDDVLSWAGAGIQLSPTGTGFSGAIVNEFSTDGTMAGNSDVAVPTEKAVKTYADSLVPTGASVTEYSTDGTMAGNSDTAVPTEQAVKTYVDGQIKSVLLEVFAPGTDCATGDGARSFYIPKNCDGLDLIDLRAYHETAGASTGDTLIQIYNVTGTADVLTTRLMIDSTETDSATATTAFLINTAEDDVSHGDKYRIDVDTLPATVPAGLVIEFVFG